MTSYFELLSIPPAFDINLSEVEKKYFALQKQYHPDKFINKSEQEKIIALQYSIDINKAYETIKTPLKRAQHLLQLQKTIIGTDTDSIKPSNELLMEIMEIREQLQEIKNPDEITKFAIQINDSYKNCLVFISKYHANKDWQNMAQETLRLGYLIKILDEIKIKKKIIIHKN